MVNRWPEKLVTVNYIDAGLPVAKKAFSHGHIVQFNIIDPPVAGGAQRTAEALDMIKNVLLKNGGKVSLSYRFLE